MSKGPTVQYMNERLQETANAQPMTVYCLLCPGWSASGTAEMARAESEAHIARNHPERVKKQIVRPRRAFSAAMTAEREAEIEEERRQRMRALGIG